MDRVYIGIPSHSRNVDSGTFIAASACGISEALVVWKSTSLLPFCFNMLLADAYNKRQEAELTHFCLLHADVVPEQGWLAKMLRIMQDQSVDVLSVLIPQKSTSGVTSTALDVPGNAYHPRRLMMREADRLPRTFGPKETLREFGNSGLLFNTGCLLMRMDAVDPLKHCFDFHDRIVKVDGQYKAEAIPEDWSFSRKIIQSGIKYAVTRAVSVVHYGSAGFDNQEVWGQPTDPYHKP